MTRRWILMFDWDGTLIDSLGVKIHNAGILFEKEFGVAHELVETAYRHHSGFPRRQVFEAICQEIGQPGLDDNRFETLSGKFTKLNYAAFTDPDHLRLVPEDTRQALEMFSLLGYPLYVSSAADAVEIRVIANHLDLAKYFREILGSKPGFNKGRQHVEFVLENCDASKREIVFIGDEPTDIKIGREAGVLTIAKAGTYPLERLQLEGPDFTVYSLCEIPSLLKGLEEGRT